MTENAVRSFRDPAGQVVLLADKAIRIVRPEFADGITTFLNSPVARQLIESGRLIQTRPTGNQGAAASSTLVLEHDRVAFPSYPYEWPSEMLHAAACLTLDLAEELLPHGYGLKDATPYNVLFRGPSPVFVDVLSVEDRVPSDPIWNAYAQFGRTFLLPLAAYRYLGISPAEIFLTRRDGIEPTEMYRWLPSLRRLRPPLLGLVSLPTWLSSRANGAPPKNAAHLDPRRAGFILGFLFKRLRKALARVKPSKQRGLWSHYMQSLSHYEGESFRQKEEFVSETLRGLPARRVLDVGCNTGHFSILAARHGASVVGIDYNPVVVGETWRRASQEGLDILPLVVDLTRPTPSIGWRNRECLSFLERAPGFFDTALMLAVVHHMLVTERIPLSEIVDLATELTTDALVIEYIGPDDPMFKLLLRGRDRLYSWYGPEAFQQAFVDKFEIVKSQPLPAADRCLYLMRKKVPQ